MVPHEGEWLEKYGRYSLRSLGRKRCWQPMHEPPGPHYPRRRRNAYLLALNYSRFTSHSLFCFRYSALGIISCIADDGGCGASIEQGRLRVPSSGCLVDKISTVPRVLPEKQCSTVRVPPERLARPISQACTRIAVQPEVLVLVSLRAPQKMVKQGLRAQARAPRLVREPYNHAIITSKKKMLVQIKRAGFI